MPSGGTKLSLRDIDLRQYFTSTRVLKNLPNRNLKIYLTDFRMKLIETLMTKYVITKIQNLCQLLLPLVYVGYKKAFQRQVRHF